MKTKTFYIGIDPDLHESGVAIWHKPERRFTRIDCLHVYDLQQLLLEHKEHCHVVLEAGWLVQKSNWHNSGQGRRAERTAKNVGENHGVGKMIMLFLNLHSFSYELKKPLGKVKDDYFRKIAGWPHRTNQEERDAAMLVIGK